MAYIQIPETSWKRDMNSLGLVETDRSKAEDYKLRKMMLNNSKEASSEINHLKDELNNMKSDLSEIKELLKGLVK